MKKKAKLPKSPVTRTKPSIAPDNRNTRVLNLFKVRFQQFLKRKTGVLHTSEPFQVKEKEQNFGMKVGWNEHRQGFVSCFTVSASG